MTKLQPGSHAPSFTAPTAYGADFDIQNIETPLLHLAFHRYASCPICNFSLRQFEARQDELREAGISYASVFHSPKEKILKYYPANPGYPLVLDPEMGLYKKYGLKPSIGAFLNPRAVKDAFKAIDSIRQPDFDFHLDADGTMLTRPADFLIRQDGTIAHVHYGKSLGDSLNVDEVLEIAGK